PCDPPVNSSAPCASPPRRRTLRASCSSTPKPRGSRWSKCDSKSSPAASRRSGSDAALGAVLQASSAARFDVAACGGAIGIDRARDSAAERTVESGAPLPGTDELHVPLPAAVRERVAVEDAMAAQQPRAWFDRYILAVSLGPVLGGIAAARAAALAVEPHAAELRGAAGSTQAGSRRCAGPGRRR